MSSDDEATALPCAIDDEPEWSDETFQVPGDGPSIRYRAFAYHPKNANQLWPGNDSLAAWLAENKHLVAGKRVLELGTATGVLGIFLQQLGAQVTTSDVETDGADVAANVAQNFQLNGLPPPTHILYDWGTGAGFPFPDGCDATSYDLIAGNDILLYVSAYPALITVIKQLLAPPGRLLIMGWHRRLKRFAEPNTDFFEMAAAAGLHTRMAGSKVWAVAVHEEALEVLPPPPQSQQQRHHSGKPDAQTVCCPANSS